MSDGLFSFSRLLLLLACSSSVAWAAQEQEDQDASATTAFIWQGFKHDWQRRVLGLWAVPHRVSVLENWIGEEEHTHTPEGIQSSATFHFAQSTGVDGDTMIPEGYYSRIHAPDLHIQRGTRELEFEDRTHGGPSPRAFRRFNELIVVDAPSGEAAHSVALIQGISFRSRCLDAASECNSDGLWPYRFGVELGTCQRVGEETVCPLEVEIGRAWTPNRGGVKVIEEKRLSERMSLDITVHYLIISGPQESLSSEEVIFENALASNRAIIFAEQDLNMPTASADETATIGISAFGFQFFPAGRRADMRHRGRYVGGWALRLRLKALDPGAGLATVAHSGGIFLPRTVKRTGVSVELGFTLLQLGHEDAQVQADGEVSGLICSDSHGAPFFSRWKKCDTIANGQEQTSDRVGFSSGS